MENIEIWEPIIDYANYEVSNFGRVINVTKNKLMTLSTNKHGYKYVVLCRFGKRKNKFIHRLVASAFIPNPNNYPVVNHINAIKACNYQNNLEWCTQKENITHSWDMNLQTVNTGSKCNLSKLNEEIVINIRLLKEVKNNKEISELYSISERTIRDIINRKTWKHI